MFCVTLTTNCRSSEPEESGVEDRSLSEDRRPRPGVRGGLSMAHRRPSLESLASDPNEWVIESLFF